MRRIDAAENSQSGRRTGSTAEGLLRSDDLLTSLQVTILEQDQSGFGFESNRGVHQVHGAEIPLGEDFSLPWSTIDALRSSSKSTSVTVNKTKQEHTKQRTTEIALNLSNEYLKNVVPTNYTRSVLIELKSIVEELNNHFASSSLEQSARLFHKLKEYLRERTTLSVYELASSGLVDVLLRIFRGLSSPHLPESGNDLAYQRANLFCSIFLADEQLHAFHILIRKLVSLLESVEKSPLFLYDTSLNFGLQIFSKRFRLRIEYHDEQHLFTDRTGKSLNMEPLATVGQLKTFLASMVSDGEENAFSPSLRRLLGLQAMVRLSSQSAGVRQTVESSRSADLQLHQRFRPEWRLVLDRNEWENTNGLRQSRVNRTCLR